MIRRVEEGPREIAIAVTENGFEPATVQVARGKPATLVITRTTERTCAREIVIDELGVHEPLPLRETVRVTITPQASGSLRFGCAMRKMVGGALTVV